MRLVIIIFVIIIIYYYLLSLLFIIIIIIIIDTWKYKVWCLMMSLPLSILESFSVNHCD